MFISTQTPGDMKSNSEDSQDKYQQRLAMAMNEKRKDEEKASKTRLNNRKMTRGWERKKQNLDFILKMSNFESH